MPIVKSLTPNHKVGRDEAFAYYLQHATQDEIQELHQQRKLRAVFFAERFQSLGILRSAFGSGMPKNPLNKYEEASAGRAKEVGNLGRTACIENCGLCVSTKLKRLDVSEVYLTTECRTSDCPETGLLAVEAVLESANEQGRKFINSLDDEPAAAIQPTV